MNCPFCHAANDDDAETCFTCGKGLAALTAGLVLSGRYEVLAPLGRGGMGIVYKAHDRELDEVVALKVLRSDQTASPDLARRFRTEIKLARRVRHPNVCAIHEFGQDGHFRFIVMELVDGVDLKQVLRQQGPFPAAEGYQVTVQIAEGLDAIHAMGILHRDLKTPNLMRDRRGVIRLMDFGIAKNLEESTAEGTAAGHIVGTPEYMSPEQVRAEKLDVRSDVYSLGVVAHEIFSGEVPFRGESAVATLMKQLNERFDPATPAARRVPPAVLPVLEKALAKNRDERYGTVREFLTAFQQSWNRTGPAARDEGTTGDTPRGSSVAPAATAPMETPAPGRRRARILIVEDNEMNRDMLTRRLARKGFDIVAAVDGGEALARVVTEKPDLILMDMRLPGLNGWEASRRLKADPTTRAIPIIALTAHAMVGDRERAKEAGCDDYDTKPVDLPRLLAKIDAHLARVTAS